MGWIIGLTKDNGPAFLKGVKFRDNDPEFLTTFNKEEARLFPNGSGVVAAGYISFLKKLYYSPVLIDSETQEVSRELENGPFPVINSKN